MTIHEFQRGLEQNLTELGAESPRFDAAQLTRWLSGQDQAWLIAHTGDPCPESWQSRAEEALERLRAGEPLQYLLGEWEFYGLTLSVGPGVLIPRADTETVVEACLERLASTADPVIWDLCSGSGAIALALASCRKDARILAAELSDEALVYLRRNIAALAPDRVEAVQTDVLTRLPDGFCDLIVSNPPYITLADMQTLSPQVRHEPELALCGGEDGLRFYRQLTRSCYDHLRPGGWLIFEIGYDQGESVPDLLRQRGFTEVFCRTDLAGVPRCAGGRRPLQEGSK